MDGVAADPPDRDREGEGVERKEGETCYINRQLARSGSSSDGVRSFERRYNRDIEIGEPIEQLASRLWRLYYVATVVGSDKHGREGGGRQLTRRVSGLSAFIKWTRRQ